MARILTSFQVRIAQDADAAKFETAVLNELFGSISQEHRQSRGPLLGTLCRSTQDISEVHGMVRARWGNLTRRYECLIESESGRKAGFESPELEDLHGLRAPLIGLGAAVDDSSVWDLRGSIPDGAPADSLDPQAVIARIRMSHGNDQPGFEKILSDAITHKASTARWYFFDFPEHGSWDYLCRLTGPSAEAALPSGWDERLVEAGAQVMDVHRYDHVGSTRI